MKLLKLFGFSSVLVLALALSNTASAQGTTATLNVYVQVVNQYNQTRAPHEFTVSVAGTSITPPSFTGSSNGTVVTMPAGAYYSVSSSGFAGYSATYSGSCSGALSAGVTAVCIVTQSGQYYNSPQPTTNPPVTYSATYIPNKLPNTGFDPSQAGAILAVMATLMIAGATLFYPYARKVVASIR